MATSRKPKLPAHLQKLIDLLPIGKPVHRSEIEKAYGRANYARRIRKIIHEYGWDIERRRGVNGPNDDWYTRNSNGPVRDQRIRREVKPSLRITVYERDSYICTICRRSTNSPETGLQAQCDHKVPAERGGAPEMSNLQTLCTECNLKKRQTCKHCRLSSCNGCPLAFPENYAGRFTIHLTQEQIAKIEDFAQASGRTPHAALQRMVEDALNPRED